MGLLGLGGLSGGRLLGQAWPGHLSRRAFTPRPDRPRRRSQAEPRKSIAWGQPLRLETSGKLVVGRAKVFGQETRFADRGHEIVASHPTRQNVQVKVVSNAGPRGLSEVHPPI